MGVAEQVLANLEEDGFRVILLGIRPLRDGSSVYRFSIAGATNSVRYHVEEADGFLSYLERIGPAQKRRLANRAKRRSMNRRHHELER